MPADDGPPEFGLAVARRTSRRGFVARVGAALVAAAGGRALAQPEAAEGFHFCGHIYTTASCPHPTGLPRVDAKGRPLRAADGHPVDDLGRPVNPAGHALDATGAVLLDPAGRPLPPAPRSRVCLDAIPERFGLQTHVDGSWYRCCGGHVRRLLDCCAQSSRRINGDAALTGYCYAGRTVFCTYYYDTGIKC
ncbi:MAG: hypothetical protein ACR2KV_11405 [Solirubrobacteraceae bacterium]